MQLIEAINKIDALKPNTYSTDEKIWWLSELDGTIKKEIIDTHEGGESVVFNGYDSTTPEDTELLVPAPHTSIYLYWLEAKMDYRNGEYGKYNNSMIAYNSAYSTYERAYNRSHMPLTKSFKYF